MSKIKLAGKSISEILKRIKRAQRNKRATQNQEKAGLSVKSVKPWNYRAGARNEQIVPVKKESQKGSSFQPHRVRSKQGAASIKETSEGSAASWRDEMDKYFGDLRPSKFFKKASGGDINTGMKKLSPKQKAIAAKAPPPDKIDAKDFAVLKAEKAKGRGMGLQDEKIKPGKVMQARTGKAIKPDPTKPISSVAPKVTDALKKKKLPGRIGTALGIGSMLVPAAYAAAKQYKDYKSAKNRDKAKVKKMGGGMMKKYSKGGGADTGTAGERRSVMGVFQNKVNRFLKDAPSMNKRDFDKLKERTKTYALAQSMKDKDRLTDRDIDMAKKAISRVKAKRAQKGFLRTDPMPKKMGGGMMQKPMGYRSGGHYDDKNKNVVKHIRVKKKMGGGMIGPSQRPGYSKGTMVKARGCKLGRTRPTKIT